MTTYVPPKGVVPIKDGGAMMMKMADARKEDAKMKRKRKKSGGLAAKHLTCPEKNLMAYLRPPPELLLFYFE